MSDKLTEGYLKQTAIDYDCDYEIVKEIHDKYGAEKLHEKLEEMIIERQSGGKKK